MKTRILLTRCPRCHRPLAAVTVGESRAATWLRIDDGVIDLDADALTWCDRCAAPLPIAPSVQAGTMLTEAVTP